MVEELSKAYEAEFQKKRNVPSRPISTIEWFQSPNAHKGGTKGAASAKNL